MDKNGFLERAGLGVFLGFFSAILYGMVAGALGVLRIGITHAELAVYFSSALLPLVFLAISWVWAGAPKDVSRLTAKHHLIDPFRVGLLGPLVAGIFHLLSK